MNHIYFTLSIVLLLLVFTINSLAQDQFQTVKQIEAGQGYSITPLPGDYDGDGDMDILGTGLYVNNATGSNATVLLRNDGGEFVVVDIQLPWFSSGGMYQWADLDNDNDLDIVAGGCGSNCYNSKGLYIYRNDGADKFTLITQPTNLIGGKLFSLVDYNNDGLTDIEIATQSDNDGSVIGHTFYKNTGNFIFQETFELDVTVGETAWSDLDNDGWIDFVLFNQAYKNLQDGTFQAFSSTEAMQNSVRHYILDADSDGDQDVITSKGRLMENDGNGQLSIGRTIIPYEYINSLLIADFDGDGHKDIVASGGNSSVRMTQLFRSNGDGSFTTEDLNEQYQYSYLLAVADMDNDKDPDILLSGLSSHDIIILENGLSTELSKPEAPTNLETLIDTGNITFSWDAATDQEQSSLKYNMYLSYNNNFNIVPNSDTTTGTSFIPGAANVSLALQKQMPISEIPEGYFLWSVQSVDDELNTSKFATPKEFTYYVNNPANAPTNLTKYTVDDQSVTLIWTDNSIDETSFTIERSSLNGNSGFEPVNQVASNSIEYTDNTVSPLSVYYYRIRLDGSAAVAYSNVIRVVTKAEISLAPTNVTTVALNSASARIDWEYAGTGITGFVIERSRGDKNHFTPVASVDAELRTYSDQQLESGSTYYYRLFAVNGDEVSDYSNTSNVTISLKEFNKFTLSSLGYESKHGMSAIAWGDYDNDGYDDLFLGYKAQLFHNEGDGTFEQVSETGISAPINAHDFVAVWGDYDNDGFLDLFYYDDQNKSSLYRGHGDGTFIKIITVISGDGSEVTNATWSDFDMDGDLDLSMTGGRYVYRNDGNDTFVRVDFPGGIPAGYYNTSVASWADYDDDGDPDVFIGNHGMNEFFQNNGSFTAITDQRVTADYNFDCCPIATHTALWTDFNNDSKLDLTIYHSEEPIYLYANNENSFDSVFYSYENYREPWKNIFWTDYDNDGDLDLFSMGQYNIRTQIWENEEGQPFRQLKGGSLYDYVSSDAAFSWNDYDNDGYSDLFQFDEDHQVYKNLSNGNSWIKIRLKGRASNSTGLGAKVFVKSNDRWQRSDVTTHHSFQVQQGFMSLFGLGNAVKVDSVKIIWPSGNRQYLTDVDVNQVILIDENDAQEKVMPGPANLIAQVEYPSSITLNWTDHSEDETGFVIEMMTEEGQFEEVGTVGINVTSFKVNDLTIGVKYKFRVRASPSSTDKWTNTVETQIRLFTEVFAGDLNTLRPRPEGLAWGDPDGDGDPDLFVGSESFEPDAIYYNENGFFRRSYLSNTSNYSRQAQWVDYDNDGHQDLHISVGGGIATSSEYLNDVLYKNNRSGQLIEQVDHILATDGYSDYTAAWGDINGDGYLDMITPRFNDKPMVYLNLEGNMTPQQESFGLTLDGGVALLSDLDNDRDLDVISANYYASNYVYKNDSGHFTAFSNTGLPFALYSFVLEDFDNDGYLDMLIIDQGQTLRLFLFNPISLMFKEKMNVFPPVSPVLKLSVGDFDNNGFLDVFVTGRVGFNSNSNRIFLNSENLQFTSLEDPILEHNLHGTAIADVNKDGHLDIIALSSDDNYNTKIYLLQGTRNENHWLRVKLKGKEFNKFGIGARVRLFVGNAGQLRDIRSGSSGTFSDEQMAHFGLGTNTVIDYIKVEWPSGENQWIANPSIDTEMIVEQASSSGPPPPASPSNLVTTFQFPGYIDLDWTDNSDNEKQFRIERAIGAGSFTHFKNLTANTTSYTDSTFVYYTGNQLDVKYRVVAISNYTVESDPSNEASLSVVITGLEDDMKDLIIYPQPASSKVIIRSVHIIKSLTLISGQGQIIIEVSDPGLTEVVVPLHQFAAGIYFLRIIDDKGIYLKKIIIDSDH